VALGWFLEGIAMNWQQLAVGIALILLYKLAGWLGFDLD